MKRLSYIFVLAMGFLAACSQVSEQPRLETLALTLGDIKWISIDPATEKRLEGQNCAANELNLPGQGFRASGADGGMTYDSSLTTETGFTTALAIGKRWPLIPNFVGAVKRDATLLIVDDFRGDAMGNNGVYKPLPTVFLQPQLDIPTLQTLQAQNKLSHGAFVFQHAKDVIRQTKLYPYSSSPSPDQIKFRTTQFIGRATHYLTIKAVNTQFKSTGIIAGSINSQDIAQQLNSALRSVTGGPLPGTMVINLSFGLVPCEAYADFAALDNANPGELSFQDYLEKLANFNNVSFDDLAVAIVEGTNDPNDPLYQLIQSPVGAQKNIFVAASGNYGFAKTAMYPAKWPGVVNVGGSAAKKQNLRYAGFNTGEIMDVGVALKVKASRFTANPAAKDIFIMGTSFPTPTAAAFEAVDVGGQQRCLSAVVGQPKSKLAINSANLVDTRLVKAVDILCP